MCWGKGQCPNSKCNEELVHTDGLKVVTRKSDKYMLWGNIQIGKLSLTIFNVSASDSGVYCCRIEVPGWFNDVKNNIHLQLLGALPTTQRPTATTIRTTTAKTSPAGTTPAEIPVTTKALPTVFISTPDLRTQAPLQTTTATLTAATTFPSTAPSTPPEVTPTLLSTQPIPEGSTLTEASKAWILRSTSQASIWETRNSVTFPQPRGRGYVVSSSHGNNLSSAYLFGGSAILGLLWSCSLSSHKPG
ncbi:T-cell immunoglobulin and mucin domain-containing protein 4 [Galemys pyrenaicus]|nr:T-cell immunoglobulin and mucin domain-containing protein 4 [Galemys pyrenaicus]